MDFKRATYLPKEGIQGVQKIQIFLHCVLELPTVYISYSATNESQEMAILKLANALNTYGIRIILDLLNTVEIDSMGGLPNWLSDNISSADKVIVVISKEYIKVSVIK